MKRIRKKKGAIRDSSEEVSENGYCVHGPLKTLATRTELSDKSTESSRFLRDLKKFKT
jgi:hypothetical protein